MAKNMIMKSFDRQCLEKVLQSETVIDLSNNRRNHIIDVLPKLVKTDKSVETGKVDKTDTNEETYGKTNRKCSKCANHIPKPPPVKGHKGKCKHRQCICKLCKLVDIRRTIGAKMIYERRKRKHDCNDHSFKYAEPVFRKQASDEYEESDYSTNTEDNLKSKPVDPQKSFDKIWNIFARMHSDESPEDIGKHVSKFINKNIKQKTEPKNPIIVDSNDSHISLPLTRRKNPIPSPTTSTNYSIESLLSNNWPIRPLPLRLYHSYHSHPYYNFINNQIFNPFRYTPNMINTNNNSLTTTS